MREFKVEGPQSHSSNLHVLVAMVEACGPIYVPKMMDIWFLVNLDRF